MPIREDLIVRQIKQLVQALLRIRRQAPEPADVRDELGDLMHRLTGMRRSLLITLSPKTLLETVSPAGELDVGQAAIIGALLAKDVEALLELGRQPEAEQARRQALELLLAVEEAVDDGRASDIDLSDVTAFIDPLLGEDGEDDDDDDGNDDG